MSQQTWSKTIRFFAVGALAAVACACSRTDEAPAPASAAPVDAAATPAATPAPAADPVSNEPLPPELAARLVRFHSPVLGPAQAPVTIVEFLDPACEACRAFAPIVKQILFVHPEEVRVVVRYAAFHRGSDEAIRILEAARRQGKFDETLTALFDRQEEWASHSGPNTEQAWQIAADAGVNLGKARRDARAASVDALLKQEAEDIKAIRVERTPTFFVNGRTPVSFGPGPLMELVSSEIKRAQR
jgi:protein-disulfide isomerase